ncbi:MAG TPA: Ger(x)C family spore germination protein [Syntrophomonadaceae bacterium]|nr:Ger(x)C family spore germination protein [Syntrophomonadaceae bacterium]
MVRKIIVIFFIISISLTSGCWDQVNINNTGVCSGLAADLTDDGKISVVIQLNKPINQQMEKVESSFVVYSESADTVTEAARKIMLSLPRVPLWQHADTFVIGEKLAKSDLSILLDFMFRSPNIRLSSYVLVAHNASLGELYNASCPLSLCSARGILKILDNQEKTLGCYIPVTANEFIVKFTTPGVDPFAPMVAVTKDVKKQDILTLDGTAVFHGKKMVGILDPVESRGLYWLTSKKNGATIVVALPDKPEVKVTLETMSLKSRIRPRVEGDKITMDISVEADFDIKEITGCTDQLDPEFRLKVQKAADEEIKSHIKASIAKGQEVNSDFLGFGRNVFRYEPKHWQKINKDWANIYPQVETNIEVKTLVVLGDLVDKSILP